MGTRFVRMALEIFSGPAQMVDLSPPSRASELTMSPEALSASRRKAL